MTTPKAMALWSSFSAGRSASEGETSSGEAGRPASEEEISSGEAGRPASEDEISSGEVGRSTSEDEISSSEDEIEALRHPHVPSFFRGLTGQTG
jgi:hypothetical protein